MKKMLGILLKTMVFAVIIMAVSSHTGAITFSPGNSTGAEYVIAFAEEPSSDECTAGVADADGTVDGRPLLWKIREESISTNDIHYFISGVQHYSGLGPATYSFVGMGPAYDSPEGPVRQGLNSQGLAVGFNVIQDNGGSSGWQKLHHQALGFYKTVSQLRTVLNSMTTLLAYNYFIDSSGEAALWESQSGTGQHWEYNTRAPARDNQWIDVDNADGDKNYATGTDVSLSGWVVRANAPGHFNTGGSDNLANTGRYQVGRDIVGSLIYNNAHGTSLSAKSLAESFFRNNALALSDNVSNMIVQGVLPTEDPRLSTMWVMLGQSKTGIFVPVWILGVESDGANRVPQYLDAGDDGISDYTPARGMYDDGFNTTNVMARTLPFERHLFDVVNYTLLPEWRSRNWTSGSVVVKIGQEMKRVQEQMDADAFGHLNYLFLSGSSASNFAPTVSIDSVSTNELEATFAVTSSDANGDTPIYRFNYGDGQIGSSKTHKYDQAGQYLVSCTATDSHAVSQTDWLFVTITGENDAPVVADIPNQTIAEGMTFTTINLDNYTADPDDRDVKLTWTYSGNSTLSVSIVDRVATIAIPNADWNGAETITFRATDPGGLWGQDAATLTVTAVNDAPRVTDIPNQTITEGATFTTFNLDDYVSDVDNSDDQMTWTYSGNNTLSVSIVERVATIVTPNVDWNGAETITFRATDPGSLRSQDEVTFTASAVNDAPVCAPAALVTNVDLPSDAAPNCTDADSGDVLTYSIVAQGANGTASIVAGLLHYEPATGYIGSDTFTYKANDAHADSNADIVNVSVTDVGLASPGAFTKISPTNNATGIATDTTLSWSMSSSAGAYEYCVATTTGCTGWNSVGTNNSVAISGLLLNQTYYWRVRATNGNGIASADGGVYWSFSTIPLPIAFGKTSPSNGAIDQAINPTLSWGSSNDASSYEYCYATYIGCTSWTSVGTNTSATLTGLSNSITHYWQVRAVNAGGAISANTGTYWYFTTIKVAPTAFAKTSPSDGIIDQGISPTLSWGTSSGATSYEYCFATSTGCISWISVGTGTSVTLPTLTNNKVYYWQVRAVNVGGATLADNGTYWSYTTAPLPGAFAKTSPTSSAANQATSLTLSWGTSSNATSYEYCYATTTGCTSWISAGASKSVSLSALHNNTTYYWQVRAINPGGISLANGGYWSFSTIVADPAYIAKISLLNGSTFQTIRPTLSWGTSSGATSYDYCYSVTKGCTNWTSTGMSTSIALPTLINDQIYYWQVRAHNTAGTTVANDGAYWSFTTAPRPGAFSKASPTNNATDQLVSPTISWSASSNAASYEYCYAAATGCTNWISAGANTSVTLSGLKNVTTYYWQVRAVNPGGIVIADTSTYWSFTTAPLPGDFTKISPINGVTNQAVNLTLSWGSSSNAASYEYCYATAPGCISWTSVGTNTSVTLSALSNSVNYYWQVRAVGLGGTTFADTGTYWTFTTIVAAPATFAKASPTNSATGQAISPTLSWTASARATSYEYCYAATSGCKNWISVGTSTSVTLSGLGNNQIYFWQVRAANIGGITAADAGTYWSFTTAPLPGAFGKVSPPKGVTSQAVSPILSWQVSSNATSYEYCYAATTGCTNWISTGANNSVTLSGLSNLTTYYWQVRAINPGGIVISDAGAYWKFTTAPLPGAFAKFSPTNGAVGQMFSATLSWGLSSNAASYEYCYATITGCSIFKSTGTGRSVVLFGLHKNQIYYWQVRAVNPGGITVADTGTYWSFTTSKDWFTYFLPMIQR